MHFPPKFLRFLQKKSPPLFFHGAFAPSFIWRRRPWGGGYWVFIYYYILFCVLFYADKPSKPVVKVPLAVVKGDSVTLECVTSSLGKTVCHRVELTCTQRSVSAEFRISVRGVLFVTNTWESSDKGTCFLGNFLKNNLN